MIYSIGKFQYCCQVIGCVDLLLLSCTNRSLSARISHLHVLISSQTWFKHQACHRCHVNQTRRYLFCTSEKTSQFQALTLACQLIQLFLFRLLFVLWNKLKFCGLLKYLKLNWFNFIILDFMGSIVDAFGIILLEWQQDWSISQNFLIFMILDFRFS